MTKPTMTDWDAEQDLAALLDDLTAELLAVPDGDIAAWSHAAGEPVQDTAQAMRRLVAAADANRIAPYMSIVVAAELRVSIARNQ
jgi:hypothetical protein